MGRLFDPGTVIRDTSDVPAAGGTATFYTSGTTTKKNTFSDIALAVANPNPITLDSDGTFPGEVFGSGSYTVLFKDANGATLPGSEDDVEPSDESPTSLSFLDNIRYAKADFNVVGDATTDDSANIQLAFNWWVAGANRTLVFEGVPVAYRLGSTVTANFGGKRGGQLVMDGPIRPDAGIGNAFEIIDGRDMTLKLWVDGGGQTADYTQADPTGADQAFYIRGVRGATLDVVGYNYKGRVVRTPSGLGGEAKTSKLHFNTFRTGDFGAVSCGQAIYCDADSAFGEFTVASWFWDDYGPVFEDVADVTFGALDSGWDDGTGMVLKGVISFWANALSLGSSGTGSVDALLTIEQSATRSSVGVNISSLLLNKAVGTGLIIKDIDVDGPSGTSSWTGVRVGYISSIANTVRGVYIENSTRVHIDRLSSHRDEIALELGGAENKNIYVGMDALNVRKQGIIVGAVSSNLEFSGSIQNANSDEAATTSAVEVNSTGNSILFNNMNIETPRAEFCYDLVAGNKVTLRDGDLVPSGVTVAMGANAPRVANNVSGYRTENSGTATILNTNTSIAVTHGLVGTPTEINVTGTDAEVSALWLTAVGATTFTVNVSSAVTANRDIEWSASLLQSQA